MPETAIEAIGLTKRFKTKKEAKTLRDRLFNRSSQTISAVDLNTNINSMDLLYRDLQKICKYFQEQGIDCLPDELFSQVSGLAYVPGKTYQDLLMLSTDSKVSPSLGEV